MVEYAGKPQSGVDKIAALILSLDAVHFYYVDPIAIEARINIKQAMLPYLTARHIANIDYAIDLLHLLPHYTGMTERNAHDIAFDYYIECLKDFRR